MSVSSLYNINFYHSIKLAQKRCFKYKNVSSMILKQKRNRNGAFEQDKTGLNTLARFCNIWKIILEISYNDFFQSVVISCNGIHFMQNLAHLQFLSRNAAKIVELLVFAVWRLIPQLKSVFLVYFPLCSKPNRLFKR